MLETLGSFAHNIGTAFVASDLGSAELIAGLLMAAGLLTLAAGSARGERRADRHEAPSRHSSGRA